MIITHLWLLGINLPVLGKGRMFDNRSAQEEVHRLTTQDLTELSVVFEIIFWL